MSALVLLSGGIDSTVLLYYVREVLVYSNVHVVLFDYGQRHKIELIHARKIANDLHILPHTIDVNLIQFGGSSLTSGDMELPVLVPARNSIFLSLAAAYAEVQGVQDIFIGCNAADFVDFPDCRENFIQLMSQALSLGNNIRGVYAPFVNKSKQEIVKLGRSLQVPFENTWSCYDPTYKDEVKNGVIVMHRVTEPCGKCHACIERDGVLL